MGRIVYVADATSERAICMWLACLLTSSRSPNRPPLRVIVWAASWRLIVAYCLTACLGTRSHGHGCCCVAPPKSGGGDLPFNRRFSLRNPTSPSALLRTRLTITASFSRPWNPSTDPSSMPGKVSLSGARSPSYVWIRTNVNADPNERSCVPGNNIVCALTHLCIIRRDNRNVLGPYAGMDQLPNVLSHQGCFHLVALALSVQ